VTEEQIRELLQDADRAAGPPSFGRVTANGIQRRIRRRRLVWAGVPAAAAALLLMAFALWRVTTQGPNPVPQRQQIASLEKQVERLQAQTDATLRLVQGVLAEQRQQQRLAALEAELASIPDPLVELERQTDRTAFVLVYQADRLYRELNQTDSAVEAYEQVIRLFPQNQWAEVARKRLAEIKKQRTKESKTEGDSKCGLQNA
jgi:tetratricopeptide (TPR) repeat protein